MVLVQRILIQAVLEDAMTASAASRLVRQHTEREREAWSHWWVRWHELEREDLEARTLVICAICHRYRDGLGQWMPMPMGLGSVLGKSHSLCVSHGLCSSCTTVALHEVKHLMGFETVAAGSPDGD